jgi:hypothetical protein
MKRSKGCRPSRGTCRDDTVQSTHATSTRSQDVDKQHRALLGGMALHTAHRQGLSRLPSHQPGAGQRHAFRPLGACQGLQGCRSVQPGVSASSDGVADREARQAPCRRDLVRLSLALPLGVALQSLRASLQPAAAQAAPPSLPSPAVQAALDKALPKVITKGKVRPQPRRACAPTAQPPWQDEWSIWVPSTATVHEWSALRLRAPLAGAGGAPAGVPRRRHLQRSRARRRHQRVHSVRAGPARERGAEARLAAD